MSNVNQKLKRHASALWRDTWQTSWVLIKVVIPVIIITKALDEFGFIEQLSYLLAPLMNLLGLPGEFGLVWASAIFTTLYAGMAIFASLAPTLDITTAQVTVLCSLMLIAHSLPIELTISKKTGAPFTPIFLLRVIGALVYGFFLNWFFKFFDLLQEPATYYFKVDTIEQNLGEWCISQLINVLLIIGVIFLILLLVRILKATGVIQILEKILGPVLCCFGMSKNAAPVTVVGMLLGIGYGGAMIIKETSSGKLGRRETFFAMALLALCHSLVEDTLLMLSLGASLIGILWGRILFALLVSYCLVHLLNVFDRKRHMNMKY